MKDNARSDSKQAATTWGLPDWHDAIQYPDHNKVGILAWCWQFCRRSPAYRAFWVDEVLPAIQERAAYHQLVGFPIFDPLAMGVPITVKTTDAMQRFALFYPVDPRDALARPVFQGIGSGGAIKPDEHKLLIGLDLRRPLSPQLALAEQEFRARQHVVQELRVRYDLPKLPSSDKRQRTDRYAAYLRTLDGKETGASSPEIAKVLFPRLDPANSLRRIKDFYAAARKLRDGGYRRLVVTG